eukprot:TRINITY_DN8883_c0_g1_i1.p1 TRINITY_DN8883_c0_g1~~TRINITY_DN8883_c0_g1_i1.p1  ORF type:complete len:726 (-),score=230.70 TRINITY_DN8883_c0_g1_i1:44-2176(-)
MSNNETLKFQTWSSFVDLGFWHEFSKRKLEIYKLKDDPIEINAIFQPGISKMSESLLNLELESFDIKREIPKGKYIAPGILFHTNTIEEFQKMDRKKIFNDMVEKIYKDIDSGEAEKDPSLLNRFFLLLFADLKKYRYYYWFGFPGLHSEVTSQPAKSITTILNTKQIDNLKKVMTEEPFFLLKITSDEEVSVGKLTEHQTFWGDNQENIVCMVDPSGLPNNPSWPMRNLAYLIGKRWNKKEVTVISVRRDVEKESLVFRNLVVSSPESFSFPPPSSGWEKNEKGNFSFKFLSLGSSMDPKKLASTAVDLNLQLMKWRLAPTLDLKRVSETKCLLLGSGTLGCNVARGLLGWGVRNITFVDNGKVSFSNPVRQSLFQFEDCLNGGKSKALSAAAAVSLIFPGANAVGHDLLIPMPGHAIPENGVEKMKESYLKIEQLVREHDIIFLLTDSREARWLGTVLGAIHNKMVINSALGFDTYVVMRHGHRSLEDPNNQNNNNNNIPNKDSHIETNEKEDVVVVVPEEEEVIGEGELHQNQHQNHQHHQHSFHSNFGKPLGCYFCNDVIAPSDSLRDRTLDQQCTVTRPGVSMMASALAVEMMVSLIHHPLGIKAPAETDGKNSSDNPLGTIPHQIRGFLVNFSNLLIDGSAYDKCTACSLPVLKGMKEQGFDFLTRVCNEPTFLEDITGLSKLKEENSSLDIDWDSEDDDDEDF